MLEYLPKYDACIDYTGVGNSRLPIYEYRNSPGKYLLTDREPVLSVVEGIGGKHNGCGMVEVFNDYLVLEI